MTDDDSGPTIWGDRLHAMSRTHATETADESEETADDDDDRRLVVMGTSAGDRLRHDA